jgi:transcriptional regulator CtsR
MPKTRPSQIISPTQLPRPPGEVLKNLDSPQAQELHRSLMGHYIREMDRHALNRRQMALDELFYDNDPWSPQEKMILEQRGQLATNFNVISATINWLLGTERRGRTDYKILPRRKDGAKGAERKTDVMKYLSDANNTDFAFSQAFASAVKVGIGFMENGWQTEDRGEPIYERTESWRNMLWDTFAQEFDLSDARYMARTRWADIDEAHGMFPDRAEFINLATNNTGLNFGAGLDQFGDEAMDSWEQADTLPTTSGDAISTPRERVRLIEMWFRRPAMTRLMVGGDFSGEIFDPDSIGHQDAADSGRAEIADKVKMRMFVAIFTTKGLLHVQESPYRHNKFPFTPIWCYRRGDSGMPYGMIRGLRDLQTHINKSMSKAQYILSTNKTIMDEGAVDDLEAFAEEIARPDAIIVKKQGKDLQINVDRDLAPAHIELVSRMIQMVQSQSGVTDESLGRTTNAVSGKAITARQDQGSLASAEPFDNLRFGRKIHGEKSLSLVEQFMTAQKEFRITNNRGGPEYVKINDGLPENDIARTKADYIISEQSWNATMRQAAVSELMEMIARVAPGQPQLLTMILDLVVESMDIHNRDEIVKRIRQMTGQKDPDADPDAPPTPEEQAQMADQQAKAQAQARHDAAIIGKLEGEAALANARVEDLQSDSINKRLDALTKAMENALAVMQVPQAAPVADSILQHADFSAQKNPPAMPAPQPGPMPPQAQPQMQPPMPPT